MSRLNPMNLGIGNMIRAKQRPSPVSVPDMAWLVKDKEECFCLLLADGIPVSIAFRRAGFTAKGSNSALALFRAQRIQDRVSAIFKARANSPPVTLPEITDMMKRVYVGAIHDAEYTPAYNAAFGLARLYGLVVDRAQLDVIRRPSREPDAPAEQALSSWIAELPPYNHGPKGPSLVGQGPGLLIEGSAYGSDIDTTRSGLGAGPGGTENGAPSPPVTGTPSPCAHSAPYEKTGPLYSEEGTTFPSAEDLF